MDDNNSHRRSDAAHKKFAGFPAGEDMLIITFSQDATPDREFDRRIRHGAPFRAPSLDDPAKPPGKE
jgi:hypothetical protein